MSDDVQARRGRFLVDAAELAAWCAAPDDGPPVLVHVGWPGGPVAQARYLVGHLPGAAFVDLDRDLAADPGDGRQGRHPLPSPTMFEAAMRTAGVSGDRPVVVYDDVGALGASRAWWLLCWAGHEDVRVLDGGLAAWAQHGLPLEEGIAKPAEGDFVARPGARQVLDADGAAALARRGVLLDARAAERYRGEAETFDPVAGHIPGARSAPTTENLGPDSRFLDGAALRERFAAAGVTDGAEVGAYCGSGVTAAHELLALEVAGHAAAPLYIGSWSEWVADPARPVARGPEPG